MADEKIKLVKIGIRSYRVYINNEQWGNVNGFSNDRHGIDPKSQVFWTATWLAAPQVGTKAVYGGQSTSHITRGIAVSIVKEQTRECRRRAAIAAESEKVN